MNAKPHLIGLALISAAAAADVISTKILLDAGGQEGIFTYGNIVYDPAKFAAVKAGYIAGTAVLALLADYLVGKQFPSAPYIVYGVPTAMMAIAATNNMIQTHLYGNK